MAMTDFTLIRRSMTSRLFSTITTVVTVAVAVALLLVLLSMREAGRKAFERGSGNMHLLVSGDTSPMVAVLNGVFYASAPARPITWEKFEEIAYDPRVEWAVPTALGDNYEGLPVVATNHKFFEAFQPEEGGQWPVAQGRVFEENFEVVLGADAAAQTGLQLNDKILLTHGTGNAREGAHVHEEFAFTVVGILGRTGTPHDRGLFTNLESSWMLHALDRMEREGLIDHDHDHDHDHAHDHDHDHAHGPPDIELTDADRLVTGIFIRMATRPGATVSAAMPQFAAQLRSQAGFTVAQPKQEMDRLFLIVRNIDVIFRAMAGVVLVSSAIAIMLALYNSMEQRRRQIAVLRVLGASRARIFNLVLTESAVIGLLGAAAGLVVSIVGGVAAATLLQSRVGLTVSPVYQIQWVLPVVVGAVLLAALAGLIPAGMAYRTGVAKNLRPLG